MALERVKDNWYTKDDIRTAFTEIPGGMEPLYERMIKLIADQPSKPHRMATKILTWVACALRPLEIAATIKKELAEHPEVLPAMGSSNL